MWRVKIAPIGTLTRIFSLESGALPACPFPAGTLIVCRAVYLFVHCAHFIALSNPFHYKDISLHCFKIPELDDGLLQLLNARVPHDILNPQVDVVVDPEPIDAQSDDYALDDDVIVQDMKSSICLMQNTLTYLIEFCNCLYFPFNYK